MIKKGQLLSDSYQLSIFIFNRTKSMPKHLRPALGRSLEESAIHLIFAARKVLSTKGHLRISFLHQASDHLDNIKLLMQLGYDLQAMGLGAIEEMSILSNSIGKQIGGLMRFSYTTNSP